MSNNNSTSEKPGRRPTRVPMPEQAPAERVKNFSEVPLGYTPEQAQTEARRCLKCKRAQCVEGCPVGIDIPGFIGLVAAGQFAAAARKIKEANCLPAICGRVCPQETQCEERCILGKKGEPCAIGRLERFVADYERENGLIELPQRAPSTGKRVAVVGSGPAGLAVAGELVQRGHEVTIFEAFHKPGGVLMYGIPEFRLPKQIVEEEVQYLGQLGVRLELNQVIGTSITVDELLGEEGYDAVFVGVGAGLPYFMNVPGESLGGVYSANEYLTRSNLMRAYAFPQYDTPVVRGKSVCVVGGGNVAMDSVRTALRLGAERAMIIYRRTEVEMPARKEEVHHAQEEGVEFLMLHNPVEYIGNEAGWVTGMKCIRMELGEPDASGRRSPVPIKGSEFVIDVDTVVVAVGTMANPIVPATTPNLETNKRGYIVTKDESGLTSREGIYAGGDIVTGSATVILAMGAGRKSAKAIHEYIQSL